MLTHNYIQPKCCSDITDIKVHEYINIKFFFVPKTEVQSKKSHTGKYISYITVTLGEA